MFIIIGVLMGMHSWSAATDCKEDPTEFLLDRVSVEPPEAMTSDGVPWRTQWPDLLLLIAPPIEGTSAAYVSLREFSDDRPLFVLEQP
ncbi:MAG: hypothetical protein H6738_22505 [Alphaproteobacteria bacterium]|nr:hypothetical protein [Alphaproteobacteria bacterium]MCB9699573.1 hypothetical protein [Alphaproteobacteria bacterium]